MKFITMLATTTIAVNAIPVIKDNGIILTGARTATVTEIEQLGLNSSSPAHPNSHGSVIYGSGRYPCGAKGVPHITASQEMAEIGYENRVEEQQAPQREYIGRGLVEKRGWRETMYGPHGWLSPPPAIIQWITSALEKRSEVELRCD